MNIAIDIDDTITDSFDYFIPFVTEYFHASEEFLRRNQISYSNLPAEWKADEIGFAKAYFDKVVIDTPVKRGAVSAINELRARGHHICILTGRNNELYTDCHKTTAQQLKKAGIEYDGLFCEMDKAAACVREHIDLFIDDSVSHCEAVANAGIDVILFTSKANAGIKTSRKRVSDWRELEHIIK